MLFNIKKSFNRYAKIALSLPSKTVILEREPSIILKTITEELLNCEYWYLSDKVKIWIEVLAVCYDIVPEIK